MPSVRRNVVFYENMAEIPHIILLHTFNRHPSNAVFIKSVFSVCLGIRKSAENIRRQKVLVKNQKVVPEALSFSPVRQRMVKGLLNI